MAPASSLRHPRSRKRVGSNPAAPLDLPGAEYREYPVTKLPSIPEASGFGEGSVLAAAPREANSSLGSRARNRRVELTRS